MDTKQVPISMLPPTTIEIDGKPWTLCWRLDQQAMDPESGVTAGLTTTLIAAPADGAQPCVHVQAHALNFALAKHIIMNCRPGTSFEAMLGMAMLNVSHALQALYTADAIGEAQRLQRNRRHDH